ncbi:MAG: hypothetical protein ACR2NB_10120 [Solirubrobacteraceae bacterium]
MHAVRLEQQLERRLTVNGGPNRSVWVIIGGLLLVLLIGSDLGGKSKPAPPPPPKPLDNARAVLVAGGDGVARTIVVPPCNAPPVSAPQDGSAAQSTPNGVTLRLSAAPAARVVLVPDCVKKSTGGAFKASGELPASAFVLPVGSQAPGSPALKVGAQTQVLVPGGSRAATVIVAPCTGAVAKKDVILSPGPGTSTAAAQPC